MWFVCYGFVSPVGRGTVSYDITRYAHASPLGLALDVAQKYPKSSPRTPLFSVVLARAGPTQLVSAASLNLLRKLAYTEASPLRGYVFARWEHPGYDLSHLGERLCCLTKRI